MFDITSMRIPTLTSAPQNTFISDIIGSFKKGIERIGSETLPNWVDSQLGIQKKPVLDNPDFDQNFMKPRIDKPLQEKANPVLWDTVQKNFNVNSGAIVMIGVFIIAGAAALKVILKR